MPFPIANDGGRAKLTMNIIHEDTPTHDLIYQIFDNGIHRFHVTKMARQTVDALVTRVMEIDQTCHQTDQHACFLYVLGDVPVTSYLVHKVIQIVRNKPEDLRESSAVVANHYILNLFRTLVGSRISEKARQSTQLFSEETKAIAWLNKRINKEETLTRR